MPDRRVILEGLLLTLTEGDSGKSAAVATARQVLAGESKPRMVLNAPRVSAREITQTIDAIRAALQEAVLNADERKASATIKRKGKDGKTKYKYPIPDEGHAKAALARINQSDLSDAEKAKVRAKAKAKLAEDLREFPRVVGVRDLTEYAAPVAATMIGSGMLGGRGGGSDYHVHFDPTPWDPSEHRRGREGQFAGMLGKLTRQGGAFGDQPHVVHLEGMDGMSVSRHLVRKGFRVNHGDGTKLDFPDAASAAKHVFDHVERKYPTARQPSALFEADTRADYPDKASCKLPHAKMAKRGKRICPNCKAKLTLEEAGYPGHESLDRSPKKNWVERAGQLPSPIQHMAKDIHEERGMPLDEAIPIAISQAKKLAAKGNQKYVRAVAEWEKLKATNAAKKTAKKLAEAATTTTDDKQGNVKAPTKEPKEKPTDAKRDPKEKKPELESVGKRVMHLQNRLNEMGFDVASDGKFGPKTAEAVKEFQRRAMVKDDGVVGPVTTNALKQAPHGEHFRAANVEDFEQPHESPGEEAAETPAQEQREKDNKADAKGVTNEQEGTGPGGGAPPGVVINIGDGQRKLREAVEVRKQSTGREFVRALARENYLRRQLEEFAELEEWSPQSRAAALLARRQHSHGSEHEGAFAMLKRVSSPTRIDPEVMHEYVGRKPGEFPGRHEPKEGERAHVRAENGERVFGTMRGGHVVDDTGTRVRAGYGFTPKGVVDEAGYRKLGQEDAAHAAASIERSRHRLRARRLAEAHVAHHESRGVVRAGEHMASSRHRGVVELHRMPNGMFAPKGQGEVLRAGDRVMVPERDNPDRKITGEVKDLTKIGTAMVSLDGGPDRGKPFQVAQIHDPAWGKLDVGSPKPSKSEYSDISKFGKGGSPGRGPTGKLRNFEAMSPVKLKQTIADLHEFGKDPEALAAIKQVAQSKGVPFADPAKPQSKPSAVGIAKDQTGAMSPNKGNLSLKDMPLGTTFEMNDGAQYKLHKSVNDPFYIVKPLDGGKAKPLHKMFAPPKVGPVAEGYDGKTMPGQDAGAAPAAGAQADDLFGMLSKSVGIASKAKAEGKQPDFQAAKAAAPAAAAVSPQQVALDAYVKAGGNDPNVIAILKKQLQEAAEGKQGRPFELREDWATFDAKRKVGMSGLGRVLSHRFQVDPSNPTEDRALAADAMAHDLRKIRHGQTMHVPLPEGSLRVTHVGGRGLARRFRVEGGGHHVDPESRRGTREIAGTGSAGHEIAERVANSARADFEHTAHHTGRVLAAREGQNVHIEATNGHTAKIKRKGDKFMVHAHGAGATTHDSADEAVRSAKTHLRKKGATFLPEGHGIDPVEQAKLRDQAKAAALVRGGHVAHKQKERVETTTPEGFGGDFNPEAFEHVASHNPMTAPFLSGDRFGLSSETSERGAEVVRHATHGPKSPGVGHAASAHAADAAAAAAHHIAPHVHHLAHIPNLMHLFAARIEREQESLRRLEEAGDSAGVMRARARIRMLREQQARVA